MRYLTTAEVLGLHQRIMGQPGTSLVRSLDGLESSLAQPHMTFDGKDLYPTLIDKASALGFSLIMNHPFVDGNKRIGHAALESFLVLNGYEIEASVDEQEKLFLSVAAGQCSREDFTDWLRRYVVEWR